MKPVEPGQKPYRILPAGRGRTWLLQSLQLLRAQTGRLLLIAVLMQLLLSLVQVPLLGIFVVLSVPALTAGILEAFHRVGQDLAPGPASLFAALASGRHLGRFFAMGGLVIVISIVCVSFVLGSISEIDEALLIRIQQGDMAALEEIDPSFMMRLAAAFAISVAIGGTLTFFAVPLVWFRDYRLGAALGQGIRALLANWKPLLVLGLGLLIVVLPMFLLMMLFMQLTLFGPLIGTVGLGMAMVLLLLFQLLLFGTQYCSFREVFSLEVVRPPSEAEDSSQLVA